jgi:hypothetical protein
MTIHPVIKCGGAQAASAVVKALKDRKLSDYLQPAP